MAIDDLVNASQPLQVRDRRVTWVLCAAAALSVLICAFHGLGMDVDSTAYLASAINLAHGHGLTDIGGAPFTIFGPALPSFVSLGVRTGMSAQAADLTLNVVSAVLTVILGRVLLRRHVSDSRLVLAGSLFIAVGWPLIQVTSLAITEPLTIVVVLLLILVLEDYNDTRRPIVSLVTIAFLLNLIFFLRYAGFAFIPVSVFVVFINRKTVDSLFRRFISAGAVAVLAALGPCLWILRNHSVDGSLLGPRFPPVFSVTTVAHQYVVAVGRMFLPGPGLLEVAVFAAVALALGVALWLVYKAVPGGIVARARRLGPWAVLLYVTISYLLYVCAAELSTKIDPIDSRLLVPVYVPCVILVVGLIQAVLLRGALNDFTRQFVRRALLLYVSLQVLISCVLVCDLAINGRDFTSNAWRSSQLVTTAKSMGAATTIYTNNPPGLWARLGGENIYALPTSMNQVRDALACPNVRIVYFTKSAGTYYGDSNGVTAGLSSISLSALKSGFTLKRLFEDSEGEIFSVPGGVSGSHCP